MPHPIDQRLGARIRQLRVAHGLSLAELAAGIGVTYQQVQKYEKGINRITARTLFQICSLLGVSPTYFYCGLMDAPGTAAVPAAATRSARTARLLEELPDPEIKRRLFSLIRALITAEPDDADETPGTLH